MLASENRLKGEKNFEKVKEEGRLIQAEDFAIAVHQRGDVGDPRFGFIISTKVSKLSTQRNRIERALSEAVRHKTKEVCKGVDVVFLAKKSIARKTTEEIMREVEVLLKRQLCTK